MSYSIKEVESVLEKKEQAMRDNAYGIVNICHSVAAINIEAAYQMLGGIIEYLEMKQRQIKEQ